MSFSNPLALLLIILMPILIVMARPRRNWGRREWRGLIVRLVLTVCVIFAIAGLQITHAADRLAVIFLLDQSDSITAEARDQADQYIQSALNDLGAGDESALIVFGKNALIDRPLSDSHTLGTIASNPIRTDTDIAGAIRLGLGMFPSDAVRRIVLLSDGGQTRGDAPSAAELAQASGVQIDTVILPGPTGAEMAVSAVHAPDTVSPDQQFDVGVTVQSQRDGAATLTVLAHGTQVAQRTVQIKTGDNEFVFTLAATDLGFNDIQVHLAPITPDSFPQNKTMAGFTQVVGPPSVLLVTADSAETAGLLPALQKEGLQVDITQPVNFPTAPAQVANYKSIILADVPAADFTLGQMQLIQSDVRDLGGGLVAIGGPNSYGPGGYYETPLEETLPVQMRLNDPKRLPTLTMVYVIDRSGSMEEIGPSGVTNLELSKEAIRRSIDLLQPDDHVGVLSFDTNPEWLVPIQPVGNRTGIETMIGGLRPGGGTDIHAAVAEIAKTLPADPSTVRHVILLTDGGADPTGIVGMVTQLYQTTGVTITSIGIGNSVPPFMADIAKAGHGIYYGLVDLASIPQIFTAETVLATHTYLVEQPFVPKRATDSPILSGIGSFPALLGYVATTPKDAATVLLTAPNQYNDPLLASWQYGLGRSVAFTSDATGRWAKNWLTWDQFGRFWSQAVNWTIAGTAAGTQIETHVEQRGDQTVLVAQVLTADNNFLNGLALTAHVTDPKLGVQAITLSQVAPGQYEAPFIPSGAGAYFIHIDGNDPANPNTTVSKTLGWALSYSSEYAIRPPDTGLMASIAQAGGGTVITGAPEKAVARDLPAVQAPLSLWPLLLIIAALLLSIDIANRRLLLTRQEIMAVADKLRVRSDRFTPALATSPPTPAVSRIGQLSIAKGRAVSTSSATLTDPPLPIAPERLPFAEKADSVPQEPPVPIPAQISSVTLAAKLLENRRRQTK